MPSNYAAIAVPDGPLNNKTFAYVADGSGIIYEYDTSAVTAKGPAQPFPKTQISPPNVISLPPCPIAALVGSGSKGTAKRVYYIDTGAYLCDLHQDNNTGAWVKGPMRDQNFGLDVGTSKQYVEIQYALANNPLFRVGFYDSDGALCEAIADCDSDTTSGCWTLAKVLEPSSS